MKKTFRNIKAGDVLEAGYRNNFDEDKFLGFTDNKTKYSETPVYKDAREMLAAVGVKSFAALEEHQDKVAPAYGHHYYAVFQDTKNNDVYCAYLFKGRWCFGTSADVAQIR